MTRLLNISMAVIFAIVSIYNILQPTDIENLKELIVSLTIFTVNIIIGAMDEP